MDYISLAKKVYKMAEKVKEFIEVDQNCRIVILKDFMAGKFLVDVPDYKCEDFEITAGIMLIYATGNRQPICDGASLVPDEVKGFSALISSIVHDMLYAHLEEIAEAWGWDVADVRKLADNVFGNDLLARNKGWLGRLLSNVYYWGVRLFGGIYHNAKKTSVFLFLSLASLVAFGGNAFDKVTALKTVNEPPKWLDGYKVLEQGTFEVITTNRKAVATIRRNGMEIKFPPPKRYAYRIIHSHGKQYFCDSNANWFLIKKEE